MKIDLENSDTSIPLIITLFTYLNMQSGKALSVSNYEEYLGHPESIKKYLMELCDDNILFEQANYFYLNPEISKQIDARLNDEHIQIKHTYLDTT